MNLVSLSLEVAELHVHLPPFLLGEEGAEWVQLGFGRVALTSNVHLVVATVDEVRGDGCGEPLGAWRRGHVAQADVALQSVAVCATGGRSSQLTVAVNWLAPPRPQIQLCVVVLQNQHDKPSKHTFLALLQQCLTAEEISVLMKTRQNKKKKSKKQTKRRNKYGVL